MVVGGLFLVAGWDCFDGVWIGEVVVEVGNEFGGEDYFEGGCAGFPSGGTAFGVFAGGFVKFFTGWVFWGDGVECLAPSVLVDDGLDDVDAVCAMDHVDG